MANRPCPGARHEYRSETDINARIDATKRSSSIQDMSRCLAPNDVRFGQVGGAGRTGERRLEESGQLGETRDSLPLPAAAVAELHGSHADRFGTRQLSGVAVAHEDRVTGLDP